MWQWIANLIKREEETSQISQSVEQRLITLENDFLALQDAVNKVYSQLKTINARGYMQERRSGQTQQNGYALEFIPGAPVPMEVLNQFRGGR